VSRDTAPKHASLRRETYGQHLSEEVADCLASPYWCEANDPQATPEAASLAMNDTGTAARGNLDSRGCRYR
jgi:hypothetical protein